MTTPHRYAYSRAGAWQAFSQLLSATGNHARCGSMHTPASSRCVLHRTDGRRIGRVNQNQFDTCPEALRFKQQPVFCVEPPRERPRSFRAELRHRPLFRCEIEILCDDGLQFNPRPRHRRRQRIGEHGLTLARGGIFTEQAKSLRAQQVPKRVGLGDGQVVDVEIQSNRAVLHVQRDPSGGSVIERHKGAPVTPVPVQTPGQGDIRVQCLV
ncbi:MULTISPECIES: hypothetical protein [Paraburkholderia]|uniref:hypothetical protein n=1 Tax=Paraburkholderia TaxID=1822464 RepID=UPI001CC72E1F|nr:MULTISPECIES: hypothetical protein [Paraburkholderia]